MSNVRAGMNSIAVYPSDRLVSFLPLSHTLERMAGYYLAMMGGAKLFMCDQFPSFLKIY
jgi:long-chain acyl-CoA synthetase